MNTLFDDLRYAMRGMRKAPGFTITVVLTLALGIGANTAIFSLINGLMLQALPYPQSDRLVMIWTDDRRPLGSPTDPSAYANIQDFRSQSHSFQNMGAFLDSRSVIFSDLEDPVSVPAAFVSSGVLSAVGVSPMLGRIIAPEEDKLGASQVAILSHGFWQRY